MCKARNYQIERDGSKAVTPSVAFDGAGGEITPIKIAIRNRIVTPEHRLADIQNRRSARALRGAHVTRLSQ
jgi:hypothetical protein